VVVEDSLVELARRLLSEGKLPSYSASQVIAGFGDGSSCALCGKRMDADQVIYELRFGPRHGAEIVRLHFQCFRAREHALGRR
jgi:hypothetical protein